MHLLQEGQYVNSKWLVEKFLGEGAFAEVYRVRHRIFGKQAMKVFKRTGMEISEVEDILQEPILLAGIHHPNIIRVYDADTTDTSLGICCFFTMEYIAGGTLEKFWKSYGDEFVPIADAVNIIRQVAAGLSVAHKCNPPIVHRDIKPQNILVGYDDQGIRARIADFGLAKKFNILTLALTGLGTRSFKPPEVMVNLKADSPAGDIWAVGICLYLLLTDRFPFFDEYSLKVLDDERFETPLKLPSVYNIQVDDNLDQLVYRCLSLNPTNRYQNAGELKEALDNWKPGSRKRKRRKATPVPSDVQKPNLGCDLSTLNEKLAKQMAAKAIGLAEYVGYLADAADLMEEAFQKWPDLRAQYEGKVTLWRKGVSG